MRPDAELRVTKPFGNAVGFQRFASTLERPRGDCGHGLRASNVRSADTCGSDPQCISSCEFHRVPPIDASLAPANSSSKQTATFPHLPDAINEYASLT